MNDRQLFYLTLLVFVLGSIILFIGASSTNAIGTVLGIIGWVIAAVLLVIWLARKRTATQ